MVRHNNMIPNGHFHKKWQKHIKLWFNQPMKKVRRRNYRTRKVQREAPKPVELLRPSVKCPSVRYNSKLRIGRGFTLLELKQAAVDRNYARTIGIAVDHRRKNRCLEALRRNAQRLKEYKDRLILLPKKLHRTVEFDNGAALNKCKPTEEKLKMRKVTEEDRKFEAYMTLRKARCDAKCGGVRAKKKHAKKVESEVVKVNN